MSRRVARNQTTYVMRLNFIEINDDKILKSHPNQGFGHETA